MSKRPAAAATAFGPMVMVAVEQHLPVAQRLINDDLAVRFLPAALRLTVRACRWRPMRDLIVTATEKKGTGIWAGILCRKRYADDKVAAAVADGVDQLVVLGAGLDTRAYRTDAPAFEVDLPANIAYKEQRVRTVLGEIPRRVHLVPVDFETDDLADSLTANGFRIDKPAMFVWEAVTQYLTEDGVRGTLAFLAKAATGSQLVVTYVRKDYLDGKAFYGAENAHREFVGKRRVWRFGLAPEDVDGLLDEYGWSTREQVGSAEYREWYVTPTGRDLPVSEVERFVHAVKR